MRPSAKSVALIRVKNKEIGSVNEQNFVKIQCGKVKNYVWGKSIQLSDGGKEKKSRTIQYMQLLPIQLSKNALLI